jgi:hypothetical protein
MPRNILEKTATGLFFSGLAIGVGGAVYGANHLGGRRTNSVTTNLFGPNNSRPGQGSGDYDAWQFTGCLRDCRRYRRLD